MVLKSGTDQSMFYPTYFWSKNAGQGNLVVLDFQSSLSFTFYEGNSTVVAGIQDAQKFHIAVMRGPALRLQIDAATSTGPTSTVNIDNPGAPVTLCMSNAYNTEIAEVVAVKGPVSDADVSKLVAYFQQKFGL